MSFNILNNESEIESADKSKDLKSQIEGLINSSKVVLFMKGNAQMPMCGFSANTVSILKHLNVPFKTFNILNDADIRQGLKEYSNWLFEGELFYSHYRPRIARKSRQINKGWHASPCVGLARQFWRVFECSG